MAGVEAAGTGAWALHRAGRRRWAEGEDEEEEEEEEEAGGCEEKAAAVLVLRHFSRPPFVNFGTVRVGAPRTRLLALENPNAEPLFVAVSRPPPASKGFAVEQPGGLLQSGERLLISITWTPLEDGKVRELITFVINNVVKHQAVLVGTAEHPLKKKKTLWNGIKKRPSQQTRNKKRQPNVKKSNTTFQISEKTGKARRPLFAFENLKVKEESISPEADSLIMLENKLSLSPILPENELVSSYTPLSLRRSTAYSATCDESTWNTKENCTVLPKCNKLIGETELESVTGLVEPRGWGLNSVCTTELHSLHIPLNHRKIPDCLVNNYYEQTDESLLAQAVPILSPDQFVKENQMTVQPTSKIHESLSPSSVKSCTSRSFPKQAELLQAPSFFGRGASTENSVHDIREKPFLMLCNEKLERNHGLPTSADKQHCFQKEQLKKRPVLSNTVIKRKLNPEEKAVLLKPKSRKCISSTIQQCVDNVPKSTKRDILLNLPVIEPHSSGSECPQSITTSTCSDSTLQSHKRKSGDYFEDTISGSKEYIQRFGSKKILVSSLGNNKQSASKTAVPRSKNREKLRQKNRTGSPCQKWKNSKRTTENLVPVAQPQLVLVKPLKTGIPRHPMPFVAKNLFYDERWKEKQQRGLTWWLNFVLTPDDFTVKTNTSPVNAASLILGTESQHKSSVPMAPSKEEVSLRAYTARCKLNKLRRSACRLFSSDAMVKAIQRLEVEIEARRLLVRKDRHLWKDMGERQKILNWLLCYNPLWLRIGLETIYGERIALENNSDIMGLAMFILSRLLWNPDIAAEYRHSTVPHLYRDGHEEALSKFTLKKLLLLVCFLDRAKLARIIYHDPCLFCKDAEFKSSKAILLAFSRDFLSGEGDLSRHLGFLGFPVNHVQTPLDEFDFAVSNLAADLQCGIRLVRMLELLSKNWNLSKKLRVPAISRLQKIHNVGIAFHVLKDHGILLKDEHGVTIDAKDIVDQHREKTFALLWKIIFTFQVNVFLAEDQLKDEIIFLTKTCIMKANSVAFESSITSKSRHDDDIFYSSEHCSENVKLLMAWVNAVCTFYNIKVENFTVSFSDGRVLCYLIHHYHPCYVPLEAICQHTTQTVEWSQSSALTLNSSSESDGSLNLLRGTFDQTVTTSALYKELLDNEKTNFQLVNAAASDLGGIPAMTHHTDMSNTIPDEKVVITYVSFLCSRLLSLCKEIRAARLIQSVWREHRQKVMLAQTMKQKLNAAIVIQKHWRKYVAQIKLRKLKKAKQEAAERIASLVIQTYWRRYLARKKYLLLQFYTIKMQARIRMLLTIGAYKKSCWAALTIQRRLRATLKAKEDYQHYQNFKRSALVIQSAFRRWKGRKMQQSIAAEMLMQATELAKEERAAVVIQAWYRRFRDRNNYLYARQSVIKIQALFRCVRAKRVYEQKRESVLALQKWYRAYRMGKVEREAYLQTHTATIVLQSAFRGMKGRIFCRQVRAACLIQSFWRMRRERIQFLQVKRSVIVIQSYVRKHQQLKRYQAIKNAVSVIQSRYRAYIACKKATSCYLELRHAVTVLQKAYRARQAEKVHIQKSVVKIQLCFRAYVGRKRFLSLKTAAVKIQSLIKMRQARKRYLLLREAAIYVQRRYRLCKQVAQLREDYKELRRVCVRLQAIVRGNRARKWAKRRQEAAVVVQAWYRMRRERQHFLRLSGAAAVIQIHYRAFRQQTLQRQKFLQIKQATITLQAAYRGFRQCKMLKLRKMAAVKIQTAFRAYAARMKYQAMRQASLVIQRWYRTSKIRRSFLKKKAAVTSLQAAFRGWQVRKWIRKQHAAATLLQSAFRRYTALERFRVMRNAARTLQQRYRAKISSRKQRQEYIALCNCILQLQAAWRGSVVRKQIQRQHKAAVVIQSAYRMHVSRTKLESLKLAVLTIQKWYRAVVFAKCQRQKYLALKEAVIKLQAVYRGVRARQKVRHMHQAAVRIQAMFKMHRISVRYQSIKLAATVIQIRYRAFCRGREEQKKYLVLRKSSLILQAAFRGMKVRQELRSWHRSATSIQSVYRMYRQRKSFQKVTTAAKLIQRWYRGCKARDIHMDQYRQLKVAVVQIQSAFRGMKARRRLKTMRAAAVTIQRKFRTFLQRQSFISYKMAAVTIQRKYRATRLAEQQRKEYLRLCEAAATIQSTFRCLLARRCMKRKQVAATVIQSAFRTHVAYASYQAMKCASVTIQEHYRAHRESKRVRELYLQQRCSALVIQAFYRGLVVRRILKKQHDAAIVLQSNYRMLRQHRSYQKLQWAARVTQQRFRANKQSRTAVQQYSSVRNAAICIQRSFRRMKARQCEKRHQAAVVLQRSFKMQREQKKYRTLKAAALTLQRRYRGLVLARRQEQATYFSLHTAVTCEQPSGEGFKIKQELQDMHSAATVIQTVFRMHRARRAYQRLQRAAAVIQKHYRFYLRGRRERSIHLAIWKAAVVIQAAYRGMRTRQQLKAMYVQRKHREQKGWAVITIQSAYCGLTARRKAKEVQAARKIQWFLCMALERRKFIRLRTAAIVLQTRYRSKQARMHYQKCRSATLVIQQRFRAVLSMKCQRMAYLQTLKSIIFIQAIIRGVLTRRRIGRIKNAIKIQALWRGYLCRKMNDTAETKALRQSLGKANEASKEEKKLCNRTALAIDSLLKYKHFSSILAALKDLEIATRLSPVCCENMAQSKVVFTIFTLIRSCNRSVPSMDVISYSVQVLLNLSKYEKTIQAVYAVENCVETLLALLQMYREKAGDKNSGKGGNIFTKTCCLLALLSTDSRRATEIRSSPQVASRLQSLFKLTAYKHQMDAQRTRARQKTGVVAMIPVTPIRAKIVPKQRPDWVLSKDAVKEITAPLQAIQMVVDTLGIPSCPKGKPYI